MAKAENGDTVRVHYTSKLKEGTPIDSSQGLEPLEFTIGDGRMIPGFEEAVVSMIPGETKTITIPPEKAYGHYKDELVTTIGRKDLPEDLKPELGMNVEIADKNGCMIPAQVISISDTEITLDANHPLAEQTLIFEINLVEILGKKV
ncbi:MAG: peptidylprolyl isomerase [Methanotrichaceae archaeon]|nr:peptidylprolyl isomerase [Methanotrichaceae archaeon]